MSLIQLYRFPLGRLLANSVIQPPIEGSDDIGLNFLTIVAIIILLLLSLHAGRSRHPLNNTTRLTLLLLVLISVQVDVVLECSYFSFYVVARGNLLFLYSQLVYTQIR